MSGWERLAAEQDVPGLLIAAGGSRKMSGVSKFGWALALQTVSPPATITTVLPIGLYDYPIGAESLELVSTSVEDDIDAGDGMRSVHVIGLDANWEWQEQLVGMEGQIPAAVPGTWRRTFRMHGMTAGAIEDNEGTILLRVAGAGATRLNMLPLQGQTLHASFTVPAGTRGFLKEFGGDVLPGAVVNTAAGHIGLFTRDNDQTDRPWRIRKTTNFLTPKRYLVPMQLEPKTDIEIRVLDVEKNGTNVSGFFDMVLRALEDKRRALPNYVD